MKKYFQIIFLALFIMLTGCDEKECKHEYEVSSVSEATCVDDGYTLYKCKLCNDTYKGDIVHAKGHLTEVSKKGYPATCTESGLTDEIICTHCHQIVKAQEKVSILGHNYDKWIEIKKPTKNEVGLITRTCKTDSNHVEERELPILVSSSNYTYQLKAPTCIELGLETFDYKIDGEIFHYEVVLEMTEHNYIADVTKPTCLLGGFTTFTCDYCYDNYVDDYVDATGHDYIDEVIYPTCTVGGYTVHTCHCGDTFNDSETLPLGHAYVDYNYDQNATCETDGTMTASCVNGCGLTDTVVAFGTALGHDYQGVVTNPTCEEQGYTTYICQNDQSHVYIDNYVDAIGHLYIDYTYDNNATCEADGTKSASCANGCGLTDTVVALETALGHDYQGVVTDPTCEEQGYTTYTCQNDQSHVYIDNYVDAIGHLYIDYTYNNDATCEADGTKTALCENGCGIYGTITALNTALGHDYQAITTLPTCEAKGYTTYTCKNDQSHVYIDDYVDELGHSFISYSYDNNATCEADGTQSASCTNGCGKTDVVVAINTALGHSFTNYQSNNDATCKEDGTKTAKCDRCEEVDIKIALNSALGHADNDDDFYCDRCQIPYGNNVVMIDSYEDLLLIKESPMGFFQLAADINLSDYTWNNHFTFYGYLYGDGYTISGLTSSLIEFNNGTIDSLNISKTKIEINCSKTETDNSITIDKKLIISETRKEAALVTANNGTIKNCKLKDSIKVKVNTYIDFRGKAGTACEADVSVYFGGFACENAGVINNCSIDAAVELESINYAYHDITGYSLQYAGEHTTISQKVYFGGFAGINTGEITNCKSTGYLATYFTITADYDDAAIAPDGRANAYTTTYLGLIAAKNENKVSDVTVSHIPTVDRVNVQSSSLKDTGVIGDKTGKEIILSINTVTEYQYLIGANTGNISEIVTKY